MLPLTPSEPAKYGLTAMRASHSGLSVVAEDALALEQAIIQKYPPMIPMRVLSELIDRKVASVRVALAAPATEFDRALLAARLKLGGRIHFQTVKIARAIADAKRASR